MVRYNQRKDGLIEFYTASPSSLISCEVSYSFDGGCWQPAAIYRSCDTGYMFDSADWRYWNKAVEKGVVRFFAEETDSRIFWNRYLNIRRQYGKVLLRFVTLSVDDVTTETIEIDIDNDDVVYLDDWAGYIDENAAADGSGGKKGWAVKAHGRPASALTCIPASAENAGGDAGGSAGAGESTDAGAGAGTCESISEDTSVDTSVDTGKAGDLIIRPGIEGVYDVFVCLAAGGANFNIGTLQPYSRQKFQLGGDVYGLYEQDIVDKKFKELKWRAVDFKRDTAIWLGKLEDDRGLLEFGQIAYMKLVKSREAPDTGAKLPLTVFFEPYSCAACYNMLTRQEMEKTIDEFTRLKPTEITCQVGRIGMKALYHSDILDRVDLAAIGDDMGIHKGPSQMVANMDVLKVMSDYCSEKGIFFTANLGVNRPYLWNKELTDGFVFRNMDKIRDGLLDYRRPEIMDYALGIIAEIADKYDIGGISLDFMRTEDNQTVDTLVEFIRRAREILDRKPLPGGGGSRKLTVRIPSDSHEYYAAACKWVEEELVDVIVPSNSIEADPPARVEHYVKLCSGSSTSVYGCIDGWRKMVLLGQSFGNVEFALSPDDIRRIVKYFRSCGAQGIFLYQGENYVFKPHITRELFCL